MSLAAGSRLGPYEVLGLVGAGGMGEVYKARDTRLDRTVAIKILPAELSADPDRRTRFEREARAVAALSHPHICTLYDIGTHNDATYLVMEHLAGESLAQRLTRGSLPVAQALDIAAQVADALDAAHKHGIIHRDLKPGNVMLTGGGSGRSGVTSAKLLDFGLAKLVAHGERPALASDASAPTRTVPMTARGAIVGTLQYMAPEQLEGREADARTDLWALGALLYEMVTGKRAFQADSDVSLIGAILNTEPAGLATLQPLTPPSLQRLVTRCLAKHPDDRWDTAHDVADELRWIAQSSSASLNVPAAEPPRRVWFARTLRSLALAGAVALGLVVGAWFGVPGLGSPSGSAGHAVAHLDIVLPPDAPFWVDPLGFIPSFALSPDGSVMAYTCARGESTQLCLRRLERSEVSAVAGTEGGRYPTFSPDGKWVLFCVATRHSYCDPGAPLKKLSVRDGRVHSLGTAPDDLSHPFSLEWTTDDTILMSGIDYGVIKGGIWKIPASGGPPSKLVGRGKTPAEVFTFPALLPGGERMLYSVGGVEGDQSAFEVRVLTVATGKQRVLLKGANQARYLATGHLLFDEMRMDSPHRGELMVATFDAVRLAVGTPVPFWEDVRQLNHDALTVSRNGALLFLPMEANRVLTWVDRQQRFVPALTRRGPWKGVQLSPDGRRVVLEVAREQSRPGVAVADLERGSVTDIAPTGMNPLWTPDGTRITFGSLSLDRLLWQPSDGSRAPEVLHLTKGEITLTDGSWSPDGRLLAYTVYGQEKQETWILSKAGGRWTPDRFLPTPGSASSGSHSPRFSPDGRWIAYSSEESGTFEVYVRSYPGATERTQVSVGGGHDAVWSRDGRELFYRNGDQFFAVQLTLAPKFAAGVPRLLFGGPFLDLGAEGHSYDVSPDSQRFLVVQVSDEERAPRRFHLVQNWFEELKAKVPAGGAGK